MRFWRAHGLGNDYLVLESGEPLDPELVVHICHRHEGLGSDGILEPVEARAGADYGLRIHNPDGSQAEKSGNGLRIYAGWLCRFRGAPREFHVWTEGGVVRCTVDGDHVRVAMGPARVWGPERLAGHEVWRVDVGNPHAVVFDTPTDWRAAGAAIENAVVGRTNVQFVTLDGDHTRALIWERGAGETRASGSSACAVAAVCVHRGLRSSPVTVTMAGGALRVDVGEGLDLHGPIEAIGTIEVDETWRGRRAGAAVDPGPPHDT